MPSDCWAAIEGTFSLNHTQEDRLIVDPLIIDNNNCTCTCTDNADLVNPVIWLIRLQSDHRPAVNDCRIAYNRIASTDLLSHCKCGEVLTVCNTKGHDLQHARALRYQREGGRGERVVPAVYGRYDVLYNIGRSQERMINGLCWLQSRQCLTT